MPNKFMLKRSRELRQRMTLPEKILWQFLRGSSFAGLHFRRQHPVGHYITDFCCPQKKLVIELDGNYHGERKQEDKNRDEFLKKRGFCVLHFTNDLVLDHIDELLRTIAHELAIDWHKNYHDCIAGVKYPQKLYALLGRIKRYREENKHKIDGGAE
jgi:very-short-patch-repair endonuclease